MARSTRFLLGGMLLVVGACALPTGGPSAPGNTGSDGSSPGDRLQPSWLASDEVSPKIRLTKRLPLEEAFAQRSVY